MSDYDKMEAGPELDALVAEKVMGWTRVKHSTNYVPSEWGGWKWSLPLPGGGARWDELPFSTNNAAAWQVIEKMQSLGWEYDIHDFRRNGNLLHGCIFVRIEDGYNDAGLANAETAPLAICLAALGAVGTDKP